MQEAQHMDECNNSSQTTALQSSVWMIELALEGSTHYPVSSNDAEGLWQFSKIKDAEV
jgi:hypothetical protein